MNITNSNGFIILKTFGIMFFGIFCLARLHNHSGPYHFIKCYVTIKNPKIARLLMNDWLSGNLYVKHMYPEYLNRISCFGIIEYIVIGLGNLWAMWVMFIMKNPAKAYDYAMCVGAIEMLFGLIKCENAAESIKHYQKLVKEHEIDLFGNSKEKNEE